MTAPRTTEDRPTADGSGSVVDGLGVVLTVPAGRLHARLHPEFQIRASGFPAEALLPDPDPAAARAAGRSVTAHERVRDVAREFSGRVFPQLKAVFADLDRAGRTRVVRASRTVRRAAALPDPTVALLRARGQDGWVRRWQDAVREAEQADAEAARCYRAVRAAVHDQIRRRLDAPRVVQAICQSSPGYGGRLRRAGGVLSSPDGAGLREVLREPSGRDRADLLTAHRYLRRFAMRCETVSFFGPSCFATLDPALDTTVALGPSGEERVSVDASAWVIGELIARTRPRGRNTPVSRDPLWRRSGDALERTVDGARRPLDSDAAALWAALDTARTLGEAVTAAGLGAERARTSIARLGPAIRRGPAVPATSRHALRALLAALPEPGLAGALSDLLDEAAGTPWPQRAAVFDRAAALLETAGVPTSRRDGAHYADRSFWHEERSSPVSERVRLGAPVVAGLTAALRAVLEPLYLAAVLARADARTAVSTRFGGRPVPLAEAATADVPTDTPRRDAFRAALLDLVRRTPADPDGAVRLDSAAVSQTCAPFWAGLTAADLTPSPALPGLDLLAAGADPADGRWVLGEVHDDSSSVLGGSSSRVHTDPDRCYARFCAAVSDLVDPDRMAGVVSRRRTMHITPELPGLALELTGVSAKPGGQVAPIASAVLAPDGAAVQVAGRRRWLYPGDLSSVLHRALSLPGLVPVDLTSGDRSPRVLIDNVVVARASWVLDWPPSGGAGHDGAGLRPRRDNDREAPGFAGWYAVQRERRAGGWPRRVFVRHAAETKPVYVDLDDPVGVADLVRLGPGRWWITECLPGPEALWWRPDGAAQAAELRMSCLIDLTADLATAPPGPRTGPAERPR